MSLNETRTLAEFADRLKIESVQFGEQRNDQLSGMGSGRIISAELAPPLWTVTIQIHALYNDQAKQIAALVRGLRGSIDKFLLCDPLSRYPQSDPSGAILGSRVIRINSISGRHSISFKGLPPGYVLTLGDKFSMTYGSSDMRYAFHEVSVTGAADSSGVTPELQVHPHLPLGIAVGQVVVLAKPTLRCIIIPGTHKEGVASGLITTGGEFKAIEKR